MSKRIPEPWAEDQYHQVIIKDDQVICTRGLTFNTLTTEEETGMNTQRIIRCVNACEGFSTEELKGMNLFNASIESINEIINLTDERDELLAQVEQLRCQLAGCGVAALQNTRDSAAQRGAPGDYGYSGSYEEVCRAVDREMVLREQRDELLTELKATESRLHEVSTLCATVEQQRDEMRTVLDMFNLSAKAYTFSDTDMKTIHQALTLVSRLKQGLWYEALFWLPYIEDVDWNLLRNEIQPIMSKYFKENTKPIDGWNTYLNQNPQMEYLLEKTEKLIGESSRIEVCTSNLVYETKDL